MRKRTCGNKSFTLLTTFLDSLHSIAYSEGIDGSLHTLNGLYPAPSSD